jgi:hypothetical protein
MLYQNQKRSYQERDRSTIPFDTTINLHDESQIKSDRKATKKLENISNITFEDPEKI